MQANLISTLYYVFLAPIMPPGEHADLRIVIRQIIDALEGKRALRPFLDLPEVFHTDVLKVLREWQHEVGEKFPPSSLRPQIASARMFADYQSSAQLSNYMDNADARPIPQGCAKQEAFYRQTTILTRNGIGKGHGQELQDAFEAFDPDNPSPLSKEVLAHVEQTWKTNSTMIDLDFEKSRERVGEDQNLCHDPFGFGLQLVQAGLARQSDSKLGLFSYLQMYFTIAADAVNDLGDRLKIEACVSVHFPYETFFFGNTKNSGRRLCAYKTH